MWWFFKNCWIYLWDRWDLDLPARMFLSLNSSYLHFNRLVEITDKFQFKFNLLDEEVNWKKSSAKRKDAELADSTHVPLFTKTFTWRQRAEHHAAKFFRLRTRTRFRPMCANALMDLQITRDRHRWQGKLPLPAKCEWTNPLDPSH